MRTIKIISIDNIRKLDRYPICPQTLDLANKLNTGILTINDLPPISTVLKDGSHILRDGRHRYTAIKLAGLNRIKAKFYIQNGNTN